MAKEKIGGLLKNKFEGMYLEFSGFLNERVLEYQYALKKIIGL